MTNREWHIEFKKRYNRIDSSGNKNYYVEEIDSFFNEAIALFIKHIAFPRVDANLIGLEKTQRTIDDIKELIVDQSLYAEEDKYRCLDIKPYPTIENFDSFVGYFPKDYMHYINSTCYASKENCNNKKCNVIIRKHDEWFDVSPFDNSSFEWGEISGWISGNTIRLFCDDSFIINGICLSYIKTPNKMYTPSLLGNRPYKDVNGKTYPLQDITINNGDYGCELSEQTHSEIIDYAVFLATAAKHMDELQVASSKVGLSTK